MERVWKGQGFRPQWGSDSSEGMGRKPANSRETAGSQDSLPEPRPEGYEELSGSLGTA